MADALVKHAFVSAIPEGTDPTKIRTSNWNAALLFTAGVDGEILTRSAASATGAAWGALTGLSFAAVSTAAVGNVFKGADPFLHNYAAPGSDGLNTFLGTQAGNFTLGPGGGAVNLGSTNTGIGHLSLNKLTTGRDNSGLGKGTLYQTTTGELNTAVGVDALNANTVGVNNTAVGVDALFRNVSGSENVAVGVNALVFANSPSYNTAVGFSALFALTTGAGNVAIGRAAGGSIITSGNNVFIGYAAGNLKADAAVMTTAVNSVYIGRDTRGFSDADSNSIVLGYTAIGMGANTAVIGNVSVTDVYFGSGTGAARLKASALSLGTTPALTGDLRVRSGFALNARNAANTADRNILATDTLDVTRLSGAQMTIANDAAVSVGTAGASMGFLFVSNRTAGFPAIFLLSGGNATSLVAGSAGQFSITAGTAARINVYWSAGNSRYELENKIGSSQSIVVDYIGG